MLEVRTKNLQASRSRTENFVSSVSAHSQTLNSQQSASPLYSTPTKSGTPQPGYQHTNHDILNLDPTAPPMTNASSDQQIMLMEEAQPTNSYINMRGEAIDMIERTINELGGVFGQLAAMVSEQGYFLYPSQWSRPADICSQRANTAHRCQHRGRRRQCPRCTTRTHEILVSSTRQQVACC